MKRIRRLLVVCAAFALACSSTGPEPVHTRAPRADGAPFPPEGPVSLVPQPPPSAGALYRLMLYYEGRSEVTLTGARAYEEPQTTMETLHLELDYREMPVASPGQGNLAASLVLDALRRKMQIAPSGGLQEIEAGDDRLRVSRDGKVEVDLRGAQPKGDMTPRSVLNRPFALLVTDPRGNPEGVTLRGIPSVKKMLASMPLREAIGWVQVARPGGPITPGSTWSAKRFLAGPIGKVGVSVNVDYSLVGFEKVEDVPCARVSLRAKREEKNVPSELGFPIDELRLELAGDAWIELETSLVRSLRVEDISAVIYERKGAGSVGARMRQRYETRASLTRLDVQTTTGKWGDGTKRFADVK